MSYFIAKIIKFYTSSFADIANVITSRHSNTWSPLPTFQSFSHVSVRVSVCHLWSYLTKLMCRYWERICQMLKLTKVKITYFGEGKIHRLRFLVRCVRGCVFLINLIFFFVNFLNILKKNWPWQYFRSIVIKHASKICHCFYTYKSLFI